MNKSLTVGWNVVTMKALFAATTILLCIVGNVEALAPPKTPCLSVDSPRLPPFFQRRSEASRRSSSFPTRTNTELGMGLRNILGKVTKRSQKDDDDVDDDDRENEDYDNNPLGSESSAFAKNRPTMAAPVSQIPPTTQTKDIVIPATFVDDDQIAKPLLRMGEDPTSKEINVNLLDQNESVQERINRVKAGKMTQEEKQAYLKAALSTGNTPETRLPLRPPAPPEVDNKRARASPFPEDPILRSIAGGKDPAPAKLSKQLLDSAGADSQKKKREYLDMVTDPHRFDVFRSQPSRARLNPTAPAQGNLSGYQMDQNDQPPPPPPPPQYDYKETVLPQEYSQSNGNQYLPTPSLAAPAQPVEPTPPVYDNSPLDDTQSMQTQDASENDGFPSTDLAYRLEAAAHAQEQQKEQQRKEQEEDQIRKKQQAEEAKRAAAAKAAEEEQRRQEILAQREKEYRERRRLEEEAAARESAKAKELEEQRLRALLDAQESFWQQKLANERQLREQRLMEEQQNPPAGKENASSDDPLPPPPVVPVAPPKPSPSLGQNNLSKHVFNPDERSLLDEAGKEDTNQLESRPASTFSDIGGKPRPSINSYLNDVANNRMTPASSRKRTARGRVKKDEQEMDEQLKRLKELNSPLPSVPNSRYDNKKRPPPVAFQPQRPVTAYSPQKPAPSVGNGAMNDSSSVNESVAAPAPSTATPPPVAPAPAPASAAANPLTMLFGNQPAPASAPKPKPAPKADNSSVQKGPIRMQIPLDDDKPSYDEEEGIDARTNTKMSIKDAMGNSGTSGMDQDERSKKWYVRSKELFRYKVGSQN